MADISEQIRAVHNVIRGLQHEQRNTKDVEVQADIQADIDQLVAVIDTLNKHRDLCKALKAVLS